MAVVDSHWAIKILGAGVAPSLPRLVSFLFHNVSGLRRKRGYPKLRPLRHKWQYTTARGSPLRCCQEICPSAA
eukprot:scaffold53382_cov28-Tisochrysis_lutea.AAC.2